MALLNHDNYYYFGRGDPVLRTSTSLTVVRSLQTYYNDTDYWLIDFFAADGIAKIKDYVPKDILQRAREGKITLLMHNSHEAFHDIVEPIYCYIVEQLNIPPKQILLLSESAIIRNEIAEVAAMYNKEEILAEWIRIFEYNIRLSSCRREPTLAFKHYEKKFLNLNRRWRFHRSLLVGLLEIFGLREKGFVSLADHSDGGGNWIDVVGQVRHITNNPNIIKLYEDNADRVLQIPPLYLDTTELQINRAILTSSTDEYYTNSYFSVVTETTFFKEFGEGVFLSEKIFKPVYKMHPFIVLSRPGTLKAFRSIGYRSFNEIIDESYDLVEDDGERMLMVVREIERLCNLDDEQLRNFLTKAKEICSHNYRILVSKTKWTTPV
jgi:hypothetical protein